MKIIILPLAFAWIAVGLSTPAFAEESMGKYILTPKPSPEPRYRKPQIHFLHGHPWQILSLGPKTNEHEKNKNPFGNSITGGAPDALRMG